MSEQQAQIDALEHLVLALAKEVEKHKALNIGSAIGNAQMSLIDSEGLGSDRQFLALKHLDGLAERLGHYKP
ncbi:hypothetical protein [Pseudomonas syringae]|uniref:hypothetical protein n=1 Tax=Pseudomonas syringae TaxID=317 RepID=UPI000C06C6C7|nr:hypothetical protein [Pseudomonas syringae]PHN79938.1 hypothetical protein AO071_05215 [Pseudomonas syringae]